MYNNYSSTLTRKGQATIPKEIRKELDVKAGDKVIFVRRNNHIAVESVDSLITSLMGSLKPKVKKRYSDRAADKAISDYVRKHGHTP